MKLIDHKFTLDEICSVAMGLEQAGIDFYTRMKNRFTIPEIKEMFVKLIKMEQEHIEQLTKIKKHRTGNPECLVDKNANDYIKTLLSENVFADSSKALVYEKNIETIVDVLNMAINMEKEGILFYLGLNVGLEGIVTHEEHQIIKDIINEEREHLRTLATMKAEYTKKKEE